MMCSQCILVMLIQVLGQDDDEAYDDDALMMMIIMIMRMMIIMIMLIIQVEDGCHAHISDR